MSGQTIKVEVERQASVATVRISRDTVHNALDEATITQLTEAFVSLALQPHVRVIVLAGRGNSFSAGADIESMRRQGAAPFEANLADARRLAALFQTIASSPKPTIARVQGATVGGGMGLICACDIAIASSSAVFATSEVRLGLIPGTIAPYVIAAIGERQARRLFQTGERISAEHAARIGLVHEVVAPEALDLRVQQVIEALLAGAPLAQQAAKELIETVAKRPITVDLIEETARRIAVIRAHPEAHEGLSSFLEKRPAAWVLRE